MHEMSLAEGILQIIEAQSPRHKVSAVTLSVGALAGVELESLKFSFEVVTRRSVAEGAHLHIESVPGSAFCFDCLAQVPLDRKGDPCPRCDGYQLTVVDGNQMNVKSLEIED